MLKSVMYEAHSIDVEHKDLIHDVAYDFYGLRLATCSSDQFVKVWDQDDHGNWHQTAYWKAHAGSVWKVTWAHPEFGQVLATCSFDRTAAVWEEIVGEGSVPGESGMSHWVRRANLVDSRTSVTDIKFAPKHLGLLLATCSSDSVVRIYEAPDIMNLSQWTLQHEIACKLPFSCLSWNPSLSRLHPPMLAVGSDDSNVSSGGKVFVFEYSENTRRWNKPETLTSVTEPVHDIAFAPNLGRNFHLLAVATKDIRIYTLAPLKDFQGVIQNGLSRFDIKLSAQCDDHRCTVWRVCWNITGTMLASSGDDGCVRLWKSTAYNRSNYLHNWKCVFVLKGDGAQSQGEGASSALATPVGVMASATQSTASAWRVDEPTVPQQQQPASKWQAPVIKGRFQKMTWLGSDPPPPPVEKSKLFKK